ncbi:MAG TPA: siderophore ABC transporter substrate-binding protein [Halanaerobiaceae bacterium]|nr:siderophore ABC transporter substrate-binding protein [Bacillota bacterium]HHU93439.1 siderophore ABC transporter substrate-binding protein [Halanaerobiaceae bacterium]HOA39980.1 siderophore ABC transporter substrate-binding protein [Halanaerobiales bacterium]HPZ62056.1 siderophore ABC transporter substrate-binding protein [Halanaerobiales bacterium]HQD03447.1 siderophore ABC transporter substrate-binding protein [Halanaerobiales bacterium]
MSKSKIFSVFLLVFFILSSLLLANEITVKHSLGEAVVKKNPERVIVFDYGTLDTLERMGIDIIGLPKSNLPAVFAKYNDEKYENVGTLFEPNFEKIYGLRPDLIIISQRQAEVYKELNRIAPTIYMEVLGSDYMGSVRKNASILAEIFAKKAYVESELEKIRQATAQLRERAQASGKNALIVMANDGNLSVYGPGSRFGLIHDEFGFAPVDEGIQVANHGQSVSFEYILEKDPDYIFVIDRAAVTGGSVSARQMFENEIIKETLAYKKGNIIYLNSEIWYVASGGLSGTFTMIEDIASAF